MRRSAALLAFGLAALSSAQYPGAAAPPTELKKGFDAVTIPEAQRILGYLAGPETEGRGTGQPGFQKAAEFVAEEFRKAGLKPLGENGTFFQYGATYYRPVAEDARMTLGGKALNAAEYALVPMGRDLDVSAPVVFVRAKTATEELSDAMIESLKGKIVVAALPEGRSRVRSQLGLADKAALLTVVETPKAVTPNRMDRATPLRGTPRGEIARAAVARLSPAAAGFLANSSVGVLDLSGNAAFSAKGRVEPVRVPNVVGILPGTDPTLKAEYVGIGGHLDHLGIQNGVVWPGADDDGSGSTAVMLVAKAVAANPVKPKRSIVFMTFYGEELGLLGSRYLSDNPPVPLDKMVAELQMDMVGRDSEGAQNDDPNRMDKLEENRDTIRLVGSKRISTGLDRTINEMNRYVGFRFKYDAEDVYTRSDHYNFARKGIPIAFLFDGFHPDYHQPTDTVDKIDFLKLTSAAKLYYLTLMKVANDPLAPKKDVKQ